MSILGAHMSIAGGYHKAAERAGEAGCDCVQIFTKNNNQWRCKPITDEEAALFKQTCDEQKLRHPISHSSYLLNIATPNRLLREKSIAGLVVELQRAEQLGLEGVVLHPGAHLGCGESVGIRTAAAALDQALEQAGAMNCRLLLEATAGQGTCLGWRFEHLADLLASSRYPDRVGVCLDTCHVFAAGYDLRTQVTYQDTMREFDGLIGVSQIRAFHVNDSQRELGSRVDRHEHIGEGQLGLDAFRWLLNDARFAQIPMFLETPKGQEKERSWDELNLCTLRSVIAG